jgi:hypothetical protein
VPVQEVLCGEDTQVVDVPREVVVVMAVLVAMVAAQVKVGVGALTVLVVVSMVMRAVGTKP